MFNKVQPKIKVCHRSGLVNRSRVESLQNGAMDKNTVSKTHTVLLLNCYKYLINQEVGHL